MTETIVIGNIEKLEDFGYSIFANVVKPHRFLRMNSICEVSLISGAIDAVFIDSGMSKCGRRVKEFWVKLKYLGNFRVKYSYRKVKARKEFYEKSLTIEIDLPEIGIQHRILFNPVCNIWKEE